MAQGCLRCLKLTMCATNFLIFVCGVGVLGYGVYRLLNFKMAENLERPNYAHMLLIGGIIITCVSFLGFLGALKENRCLLMTFFLLLFLMMLLELTLACLLLVYDDEIAKLMTDHKKSLENTKGMSGNSTDVMSEGDLAQEKGYLMTLKSLFEEDFLITGISVIVLCIIEVLGMCFAMTLFCHISRSGLGYKL